MDHSLLVRNIFECAQYRIVARSSTKIQRMNQGVSELGNENKTDASRQDKPESKDNPLTIHCKHQLWVNHCQRIDLEHTGVMCFDLIVRKRRPRSSQGGCFENLLHDSTILFEGNIDPFVVTHCSFFNIDKVLVLCYLEGVDQTLVLLRMADWISIWFVCSCRAVCVGLFLFVSVCLCATPMCEFLWPRPKWPFSLVLIRRSSGFARANQK